MNEFFLKPPPLMLLILWLSLVYIVIRFFLKLKIIKTLFTASTIVKQFELPVVFLDIFGMCLRKTDPVKIVLALAVAKKAGIETSKTELESHYLCGGDPGAVLRGLVVAKEHNMKLTFKEAAAIDLSEKDVVAEIQKALGITSRSVQDILKDKI